MSRHGRFGFSKYGDLTGNRYGKLVVMREVDRVPYYRNGRLIREDRRVECMCDCGNTVVMKLLNVARETGYRSCGCNRNRFKQTHGACVGPKETANQNTTYRIWWGMLSRCKGTSGGSGYTNYFLQGIKVCARWKESYVNFIQDMGERPGKEYSLDRIDPFGDYTPENCRWATWRQQHTNRKNTIKVMWKGEMTPAILVAEYLNVEYERFIYWMRKGFTPEEIALKKKMRTPIAFQGVTKLLTEWCREFGIGVATVKNRVRKGWSYAEAFKTPPYGNRQHPSA